MAINDDVFRAILAIDSYNRGYNSGINFGPNSDAIGTQIGNATISARTAPDDTAARAASFYALAYNWNNHQIISYRGTDVSSRCARKWFLKRVVGPGLSLKGLLRSRVGMTVLED